MSAINTLLAPLTHFTTTLKAQDNAEGTISLKD